MDITEDSTGGELGQALAPARVQTVDFYGDPIPVSEMATLYVTARPVRNGVVMEITYSNTL